MTASRLGPLDRQKTLPLCGSSHAWSKLTPSSAWIARSRRCASSSCAFVAPTNPSWMSMYLGMGCSLLLLRDGRETVEIRRPGGLVLLSAAGTGRAMTETPPPLTETPDLGRRNESR